MMTTKDVITTKDLYSQELKEAIKKCEVAKVETLLATLKDDSKFNINEMEITTFLNVPKFSMGIMTEDTETERHFETYLSICSDHYDKNPKQYNKIVKLLLLNGAVINPAFYPLSNSFPQIDVKKFLNDAVDNSDAMLVGLLLQRGYLGIREPKYNQLKSLDLRHVTLSGNYSSECLSASFRNALMATGANVRNAIFSIEDLINICKSNYALPDIEIFKAFAEECIEPSEPHGATVQSSYYLNSFKKIKQLLENSSAIPAQNQKNINENKISSKSEQPIFSDNNNTNQNVKPYLDVVTAMISQKEKVNEVYLAAKKNESQLAAAQQESRKRLAEKEIKSTPKKSKIEQKHITDFFTNNAKKPNDDKDDPEKSLPTKTLGNS